MTITLETIKNIIGLYFKGDMLPEEFADMFHDAQLKVFVERWRNNDLDPIVHFVTVMGDGTPALTTVNGFANVPYGFFKERKGFYRYKGVAKNIEFVTDDDLATRLTHAYEFPTADYPVAVVHSDKIRFHPTTVQHVVFTYLQWPQLPVYAVTYDKGLPMFDSASSSEVLWGVPEVVEIIQLMLQSLNIQVNQSEIQKQIK
jgi:hypothetical protein